MLSCRVSEARPELSPQGGLVQEDGHSGPREGCVIQEVLPQHPPHSGFFVVFREGENYGQTHSITVSKTPEITSWATLVFKYFELLMKKVSDAI